MSVAPLNRCCREFVSDRLGFVISIFLFLAAFSAPAQIVDLNGSGMSTIWEWTYNAYGINPNIDSDGDGFLNWQEAIAGTDPYNSSSYPHIATSYPAATNIIMVVPSQPGKLYTLESTTNVLNANWVGRNQLRAAFRHQCQFRHALWPRRDVLSLHCCGRGF